MDGWIKRALPFAILVCWALPALSDNDTKSPVGALRDFRPEDIDRLKAIKAAKLTPDGKWLAYALGPCDTACRGGSVSVFLREIAGTTERRYEAGEINAGAGNMKMSPSGAAVAFQFVTPTAEGRPSRLGLAVIDVRSGERRDFPDIRDFQFVGSGPERLLMRGYPEETGNDASTLRITQLAASETHTIKGVREYAVNRSNSRMAWSSERGLEWIDFTSMRVRQLDATPGSDYSKLVWSATGNALAAFLKDRGATVLVAFTKLGASRAHQVRVDPRASRALNGRYDIQAFASYVRWRADDQGLFFGVRASGTRSAADKGVGNLTIWHSRDSRLPLQRKAEERLPRIDWWFLRFDPFKVVRLSDDMLAQVEPHPRGAHVLGYDLSPYGWSNELRTRLATSQSRDYYLVDIQSGRRTLIQKDLRVVTRNGLAIEPQLSPNGSVVLFQNNLGDYVVYDIATGGTRNLTAGLPTKFYFEENNPAAGRQPRDNEGHGFPLLQAWTSDQKFVLISDYFDVWALPLRSGKAVNLTGDGRSRDISYSRMFPEEELAPAPRNVGELLLDAPIYFRGFELKSGKVGALRKNPGRSGLESLAWDYADIVLHKAQNADTFLLSRTTNAEPRDFFRLNKDWSRSTRLTDAGAALNAFRVAPQAKYLTYRTSRGKERHAILYPPAGSPAQAPYPTVVEIYRGMSHSVHTYWAPYADTAGSAQRGYAVLKPDIEPRISEPGPSALEDVMAAVDAATATGLVDRDRMALAGHSYGAYATSYIIAHTDVFKAALAYAGMSDLWSDCNGIFAEKTPKMIVCETDQPYLGGTWWEQWPAYIQNSPLFHARTIHTPLLLAHGDNDANVNFSQSVEFFNTLRRLGNDQVVLLQYHGEPHSFSAPTIRDFSRRLQQFFDHFLKGEPAPDWWADGVSRYAGQVPAVAP